MFNTIWLFFFLRPFNGLVSDIKRKIKYYTSDFRDCFNLQCFASMLYMYLVSLCSLVAFGALLEQETDNTMVKKNLIN